MCGQLCVNKWGIESGGVEVKNRGDGLTSDKVLTYLLGRRKS